MRYAYRILAVLAFSLASGSLWGLDLAPGQGVSFTQVSYPGVTGGSNTSIGVIEVDLNVLRNKTGLLAGYLNVATAKGWVVRNLPVIAENLYPYSGINTAFDLGIQAGTAASQLTAALQYTDTLVTSFSAAPGTVFSVAARAWSMGGAGVGAGGPLAPPTLNDVLFGNPADNDTITQFDHPNAEAAKDQCMPMSVANSLQYLKDTQGLQLPHEHKMGLNDNSLVGQLEQAMGRAATTRRSGSGTWGLQGKLKYLAANNLDARISTTHWGVGGPDSGASNVSMASGGVTATSTGKGASVNFDQVLAALKEGQDCELIVAWGGGGAHAVDLVGAGKFRGQPWIMEASDVDQDSDSLGAGPAGMNFHYLSGPDASGQYSFGGTNDKVVQVICEKYVPPPATETITELIDPAGHSPFVTAPPSTVTVTVTGTTISLSGSASWMPLTGTISASGAFNLTGSGTAAGFSNVSSSFVGTATSTGYTGTITVGTKGELYGVPISWKVTISNAAATAMPAVRMNGFRHDFSALAPDLLRLSVSMKAGAQAGKSVDWWLVAVGPSGVLHFNLATMSWQSGLAPTYTGPLGDLPFFALPYSSFPKGTYDVYFGFDTIPNGSLDVQAITYDVVHVVVN